MKSRLCKPLPDSDITYIYKCPFTWLGKYGPKHWALESGLDKDGRIVVSQLTEKGYEELSLLEFADRFPNSSFTKIHVDAEKLFENAKRLYEKSAGKSYSLFFNNCEHYVKHIIHGKPYGSWQVIFWSAVLVYLLGGV